MVKGWPRSNLAYTMIKLHRYDEARRELVRVLECKKPYGHAAEPWKTWDILHHLEQAINHPEAAAQAQRQAMASHLAYRRAGGASQPPRAKLYALVTQVIQQGGVTTELEQFLAQLSDEEATPPLGKLLISKLQAILRGARDPALAGDPNLDYGNAVPHRPFPFPPGEG